MREEQVMTCGNQRCPQENPAERLEPLDGWLPVQIAPPEDPVSAVKGTTNGLGEKLLEERTKERERALLKPGPTPAAPST